MFEPILMCTNYKFNKKSDHILPRSLPRSLPRPPAEYKWPRAGSARRETEGPTEMNQPDRIVILPGRAPLTSPRCYAAIVLDSGGVIVTLMASSLDQR